MSNNTSGVAYSVGLTLTRLVRTWNQQTSESCDITARSNMLDNLRDAVCGISEDDPIREHLLNQIGGTRALYVTAMPAPAPAPAVAPVLAPAPAPAPIAAPAPAPAPAPVAKLAAVPAPVHAPVKAAAKKAVPAPVHAPAAAPAEDPAPVEDPAQNMADFETLSALAAIVNESQATFKPVARTIPARCRAALKGVVSNYIKAGDELLEAFNDQAAKVTDTGDAPARAAARMPAPDAAARMPAPDAAALRAYESDDEEDIDDM